MLRRAPHILQRVYLRDLRDENGVFVPRANVANPAPVLTVPQQNAKETVIDNNLNFMLLEFMKYGNLDVMIKKLQVYHGNNWGNNFTDAEWNQFLWHLADCCKCYINWSLKTLTGR